MTLTTARADDEPVEDVSFDALRTGFTASVSHELRTPLGAHHGAARLDRPTRAPTSTI